MDFIAKARIICIMSESEKNKLLTTTTKVFAVITLVSGVYGVSYQKGMIMGMGMGNLNGNYDIREIFNSAVFGYIDLFSKAIEINVFDIALANWKVVIPFAIMGVFVPIIINFREKLKKYAEKTKNTIKSSPRYLAGSYFWAPLVGAAVGAVMNIVGAVLSLLVFFVLSILLLPALIGYISGEAKVQSIKGQLPCDQVSTEILKSKYIRQCTQLTIKGKKIMGEVLLENSEGYFMHLNKAFLYISKSKELCIYSKYEKSEVAEGQKDFQFESSQIDDICLPKSEVLAAELDGGKPS